MKYFFSVLNIILTMDVCREKDDLNSNTFLGIWETSWIPTETGVDSAVLISINRFFSEQLSRSKSEILHRYTTDRTKWLFLRNDCLEKKELGDKVSLITLVGGFICLYHKIPTIRD